jgi:hypothetical protein
MRKFLPILLVLLFGCNKGKERKVFFEKKEDTKGLVAFVTRDTNLLLFNLEKESLLKRFPISPVKIFSHNDSLYCIGDWLYYMDLQTKEIKRVKRLKPNFIDLVFCKGKPLIVQRDGFQGVKEKVKKVYASKNRIYILGEKSLRVFNKDLKEISSIAMRNASDFCVAPYGLRIYFASPDGIKAYNGKDFSLMKTIPVQAPRNLIITPAGNKLYATLDKSVLVMKKTTARVTKIIEFPKTLKKFILSRDGSYGIALLDDRIIFIDAGIDNIVKTIFLSGVDCTTSPGDSKIYLLTRGEIVVINSANLEVEGRIPVLNGKRIFVPRVQMETEESKPPIVREGKKDTLFTVQVGSFSMLENGKKQRDRLIYSNYPAYITLENGKYRIRVGAFQNREDARYMRERLDRFLNEKTWVLKAPIDISVIPDINSGDVNRDSSPDFAFIKDANTIVIFEIKDKLFQPIFTIKRENAGYTGDPEIRDIDGDGKFEIVTPTKESGKYSVIRWKNEEWVEKTRPLTLN